MRRFIPAAVLMAAAAAFVNTARVGVQDDGSIIIPTGQTITPAGNHLEVADRPLGMALSPDGRTLAVVTGSNFASRRLHLIDADKESVRQSIAIGDSFVGVAFGPGGERLYVGGGRDDNVKIFLRQDGGLFRAESSIAIANSAPSGLALDADGRKLYCALNLRHAVGIVDLESGAVKQVAVGSYPYTAVVAGRKVYVSNWGGRKPAPDDPTDGHIPVVIDPKTGIASSGTISVLDTESQTIARHIDVGLHPSAMALSADGRRLYVANANSDTISVIDTGKDAVERTLDVRPSGRAPLGSAPNALALSPDGKRLYVANAANNAVAVVDLERDAVTGFIPTGWFPTAVALSADGERLFIASGYGFGSIAPPPAGQKGRRYSDRTGVVSVLKVPDEAAQAAYTRQVMFNNRARAGRRPVPMNRAEDSPIKHVFYIIKENRTYDQVLGDLAQGNGDPSLAQFPREVTPNHHALAEQFVLLDNYYQPGDQSSLGHQWCDEAYANDYSHKYGNARNDYAGTNPMAYAPSGFLWDNARNNGRSVRIYGEFAQSQVTPGNATWSAIYQAWKNGTAGPLIRGVTRVASVRGILAPGFPGFDMRITDQVRADEFLREFREFEESGKLPDLMIMLLPDDHTNGTSPGYPTPRAMVADNDLALGRIVEAISKSRYWRESAIFITEDDAQAGTDHVDGHRTVGLVASPWARRKVVDSTLYTTINMFRTVEQILGLAPLNQYDLGAEPMFSVFADEPDFAPYAALPNQIALDEMNPPMAGLRGLQRELALQSMKMDFSEPDAAPEQLLNRAIWHSVKGYHTPYPARR